MPSNLQSIFQPGNECVRFRHFVEKLAARLASFDRQALAAGKAQINRASLPPQGDLLAAYGEYEGSLSWPGFQARMLGFGQRIAAKGLVEIELNLGAYIGGAKV
jgi:hypothetical protein